MIRYITISLILALNFAHAKYYSQCTQDQFVNENYFNNKKNGVFVDVGAHNGISVSNTYFFENELGWTGVCIEPMPDVFEKLQKNRTCLCIRGCATPEHNVMKDFLKITGPLEMLSGLIDKFDEPHMARIEKNIKEMGGSYEVIEVPCYNLNKILKEAGIKHVNFLSLDTEGGEFGILQDFDFSSCQVDVITVEDNYNMHPFVDFLKSKGFVFIKSFHQDKVFVNKNVDPIGTMRK